MATVALDLAVLAAQGVLGVDVVVEQDITPGLGVVAGLALLAKTFLVLVILPVAGHAGHRRALEGIVPMAIGTLGLRMLVLEPEAGLVVIKLRLLPVGFRVAIRALRTQLALVCVVLLVAGNAACLRAPVLAAWAMAFAARRLGMLSLQQVIRLPMVEFLFVQNDQASVAALVFGMAFAAQLPFRGATVKALLLRNIARHILVAVRAQRILPRTLEADMTLVALLFRLGMPLYHLARHQHTFKRISPGWLPRQPPGQDQQQRKENFGSHGAAVPCPVHPGMLSPTFAISTCAPRRRAQSRS